MNEQQKTKFFPELKNDRAAVEAVFGPKSSAALATRIKREDPALYQSLKSDAATLGFIDTRETPAPPSAFGGKLFQGSETRQQSRTMSDSELEARARFSETDCRRLFIEKTGTDAAAALKRNDSEAYQVAKIAAQSFGILNPSGLPQRPAPSADFVGITLALAAKANLPPDLRVSLDQLDRVIRSVAAVEFAKQQAAKGAA